MVRAPPLTARPALARCATDVPRWRRCCVRRRPHLSSSRLCVGLSRARRPRRCCCLKARALTLFGSHCASAVVADMTTSLLPSPLLATSVEAAAELLGDYDDLRCPICFGLMLAPRRLPRCSARHTFCGQCIAFWLQSQRDGGLTQCCPIDRRPLAADEHPEIDFELSRRVETLVVSCPNRSLGCAASFALRDGAAHLASECRYRTVQCPSCQKPHTAAALARHMDRCFKHCDGCGLAVPRADLHHHEMALCLTKAHAPWWQPSQASAFKALPCMHASAHHGA